MSKQSFKEALNLAQKLAEFANLTPEGVNDFRNDNPEFVPAGLWTTSSRVGDAPTITPRWQEDQQLLRKAWLNRFPPDDCIRLIVEWANFYWGDESVQRTSEALQKMDATELEAFMSKPENFIKPKAFEAQQAVMFLHDMPWRASRCEREKCRNYFIKDAKGRRFCSPACFTENRKADKRKYWGDTGSKQRAKKNKAKKRRTKSSL
ncbi:MAG: hypothetical protein WB990_18970 [Candidatus Acidiferrales bacterium]